MANRKLKRMMINGCDRAIHHRTDLNSRVADARPRSRRYNKFQFEFVFDIVTGVEA